MSTLVDLKRDSTRTRARILEVARRLFAQRGDAGATVRAVAAEAGVDPALVIRYFGSKDGLFIASSDFRLGLPALSQLPRRRVGVALARRFVTLWDEDAGMTVLLRAAASNHEAAMAMRDRFAAEVFTAVAPLGSARTAGRRAALVASQVLGVAFARYVLALPPLVTLPAETLIEHLGALLQLAAVERPRRARK